MVIPRSVRQEENEVHMGGMENAYRILFGNPEIKMLFGRPRYRLEDEAKTDLKGLWCELWSLLNWFRGLSSELLERAHSVLYATDRTLQVGICYSSNQIKSNHRMATLVICELRRFLGVFLPFQGDTWRLGSPTCCQSAFENLSADTHGQTDRRAIALNPLMSCITLMDWLLT